ncbi:hypothetical protein SFUL_5790 [Streptomyces microflavus DSM 40593]|uniref:Uncharacterized protein n=1 Tax=Streptomyces microflavus DSM 40593 TaxID=1303692 RepID=N0D451_STRMI|nr:hypothetical protein SFUL_5790 [Streptomyces microflavus DSM 40593]
MQAAGLCGTAAEHGRRAGLRGRPGSGCYRMPDRATVLSTQTDLHDYSPDITSEQASNTLRDWLQSRHALHMMCHRKHVGLSASRKSPGQTPFLSSPSLRVGTWSVKRASQPTVGEQAAKKPALPAGQPPQAPDVGSRHAPHHLSDRHHGAMPASRELVKHGLAGTWTSQEELPALGAERALEGYSVTIAAQLGDGRHPGETVRERQRPAHSRKGGKAPGQEAGPCSSPGKPARRSTP